MSIIIEENVPHFELTAGSFGPEDLRVLRFSGNEGISELYRYEIELTSLDAEIDFTSIVGQDARLSCLDQEGDSWIHGIICRFEQLGRGGRFAGYRARLVPKVWALTLRNQSRIFQNLAVPEIIKAVLDAAGVPADLYDWRLKGEFKPREYCVQYRESDWDFISRLMEEEGIFYFFQQTEDAHILIIGNDSSSFEPIDGEDSLPYREPGFGAPDQEAVTSFRYAQSVRQGTVTLRDFDFKKPSLSLETNQAADTDADLEYYDYPGEYLDTTSGGHLAEIRLDELRTERFLGSGEAACTRMRAGYRFTIEDHPREDYNEQWLLVRLQHWGSQPQSAEEDALPAAEAVYHNAFQCIPHAITFRPRRWTPRPRVEGPQTAIVTGPKGEEIHTDQYGRVKVQFHWDRQGQHDEKSSCWIRVSQGWAGPGWGMMVIPRIGQEVIVDFLEGDPDQPIITGRVYNGENPPPYALPGEKTKSVWKSDSSLGSGGFNEIRFEDKKGNEEFHVQAEKDQTVLVKHDQSVNVKRNRSVSIGGSDSVSVTGDRSLHVHGNRSVSVDGAGKSPVHDTLSVTGKHSETISSDTAITIGGAYLLNVTTKGATYHVKGAVAETFEDSQTTTVTKTVTIDGKANILIKAADEIKLQVGAHFISIKKSGEITLSSDKIAATAGSEAKLGVGNQNITCDKQKAAIAGAAINSSAVGMHEISGAVVKIN